MEKDSRSKITVYLDQGYINELEQLKLDLIKNHDIRVSRSELVTLAIRETLVDYQFHGNDSVVVIDFSKDKREL